MSDDEVVPKDVFQRKPKSRDGAFGYTRVEMVVIKFIYKMEKMSLVDRELADTKCEKIGEYIDNCGVNTPNTKRLVDKLINEHNYDVLGTMTEFICKDVGDEVFNDMIELLSM